MQTKIEISPNRNGAPVESRQAYQFPPVAMRTGQAAHYMGLSRRTVFKLASRGRLPVVRVSAKCLLFKRSDLDAFIASRRVAAIGEGQS